MRHVKNIFMMLIVTIGLMAIQDTKFGWLLVCYPVTLWGWPLLSFMVGHPIRFYLLIFLFFPSLFLYWQVALSMLFSILVIWVYKKKDTLPPRPKSGIVIKNYYFW